MRQANLAQLDDVVKRFRSQDQEQSRNLEIVVSRLDADFAQLSADQVKFSFFVPILQHFK